ncbi:MAG: hypothetical protein ACFFCS_23410 [Candidatus Hodarchaeota archaeon]
MEDEKIRSIILDFVHSETGWGNPLRPHCEFEDMYIREREELPDGGVFIKFQYNFDEDGFSQYDKTHVLMGTIKINKDGKRLEASLEETHTGVAAHRYYGTGKKEKN